MEPFHYPVNLQWNYSKKLVKKLEEMALSVLLLLMVMEEILKMIRYFIQNQLEKRRNYAIYFFDPETPKEVSLKANKIRKSDASFDMHGGENET